MKSKTLGQDWFFEAHIKTSLAHGGTCSGTEIVKALLAAGANVNTKAPGGATPLMLARFFHRTEVEAVLRRAGARE